LGRTNGAFDSVVYVDAAELLEPLCVTTRGICVDSVLVYPPFSELLLEVEPGASEAQGSWTLLVNGHRVQSVDVTVPEYRSDATVALSPLGKVGHLTPEGRSVDVSAYRLGLLINNAGLRQLGRSFLCVQATLAGVGVVRRVLPFGVVAERAGRVTPSFVDLGLIDPAVPVQIRLAVHKAPCPVKSLHVENAEVVELSCAPGDVSAGTLLLSIEPPEAGSGFSLMHKVIRLRSGSTVVGEATVIGIVGG
jgi:hypothetical protein